MIQNTGTQSVSLAGSFPATLVKGGTCADTLAAGQSCTLTASWAPTVSQTLDASIKAGSLTMAVTGSAITPAKLSGASSQDFGKVQLTKSAERTWTLTNSGQETATLNHGALPAGVTRGGTCAAALAGESNCTVTLTWSPTAVAMMASSYTVSDQVMQLTGQGIHTVVDYRSLMLPSAAIGIAKNVEWGDTGQPWYWNTANAQVDAAITTVGFTKTIYNPSETPVAAELLGAIDNVLTAAYINGAPATHNANAAYKPLVVLSSFQLQPGWNVVRIHVYNAGGPAGFSAYVPANGISDTSAGWTY